MTGISNQYDISIHTTTYIRQRVLGNQNKILISRFTNFLYFTFQIPESCCVLTGDRILLQPEDPTCINAPNDTNSYINMGCFNKLTFLIEENLDLVIGAVVVVAAVELLAIFFSFCLCRAVGRDRDYHYKY